MSDISALTAAMQAFRDARNWRQFHSLRNLIVSLNLEAAELLELTQWKNDAEVDALPADPKAAEELRDECADILLLLLLVADKAGIDLPAAAWAKLAKNESKYPVRQGLWIAGQIHRVRLTRSPARISLRHPGPAVRSGGAGFRVVSFPASTAG